MMFSSMCHIKSMSKLFSSRHLFSCSSVSFEPIKGYSRFNPHAQHIMCEESQIANNGSPVRNVWVHFRYNVLILSRPLPYSAHQLFVVAGHSPTPPTA